MSFIVRAIDTDGDWEYGQGFSSYKTGQNAVTQKLGCRLNMFQGDCFFATRQGIDWFNLLGGKDKRALQLAITTTILNTNSVTGIVALNSLLGENRGATITYTVNSIYSTLAGVSTVTL